MRRDGFALKELIVVLAVIGILLTLGGPLLAHKLFQSRVAMCLAIGKSIQQSFYNLEGDLIADRLGYFWPQYGPFDAKSFQFQTSTALFTYVVTNGGMPVNFSFFAPPGVRPATGGYSAFSHTNNGWCVVGNVEDDEDACPDTMPFLFTKNLINFPTLGSPIPSQGEEIAPTCLPQDEHAPFGGRDAFVFIMKSGAGFGLYGEKLKYSNFTNLFQQVDTNGVRLTNPILRP